MSWVWKNLRCHISTFLKPNELITIIKDKIKERTTIIHRAHKKAHFKVILLYNKIKLFFNKNSDEKDEHNALHLFC